MLWDHPNQQMSDEVQELYHQAKQPRVTTANPFQVSSDGLMQDSIDGNKGFFFKEPPAMASEKPQLIGSSAQNSSGVNWCRHRVRFNEVPEKVPKAPEVWEDLV